MKSNKVCDFIIVGQGLAGTVLSHQLIQKGYSVMVFENYKSNSATRIAAGVFNPVTYRKLKMAEFADFLIPEVFSYYPLFAQELGSDFFEPTSFLKIITDIEELNNWQIQCSVLQNAPFMSGQIFNSNFDGTIKAPNGAGQVLKSGVVKLSMMLLAWKEKLTELNSFTEGMFSYDELEVLENGVKYKSVTAKKIVFCEGVGILENPWFNWLPMQQFKGEVLEIHAPELKLTRVVNRGVFIMPMGNDTFKIGATHDWKNVDENITEDGKKELTDKLDNILNVPYKVVNHVAGLRPASRDRRPYIGVHPANENMFVINGLGSKGVIMAPWLVKTFISGLESKEWTKSFDIKRYLRFYNENN